MKREMEALQDMLEMDLVEENKRLQNENHQLKKQNGALKNRADRLAEMYKSEWIANKPSAKKKINTTKKKEEKLCQKN